MVFNNVCMVISAYNEEQYLAHTLTQVTALLKSNIVQGIVVVDDGSTDKTAGVASGFRGVKLIRINKNIGKGGAALRGILHAKSVKADAVILFDADLEGELHPSGMNLLLAKLDELTIARMPRQVKMAIYPQTYSCGQSVSNPEYNLSGIRAIRMSALNFLFVQTNRVWRFSESKTASFFLTHSDGYWLESALNWRFGKNKVNVPFPCPSLIFRPAGQGAGATKLRTNVCMARDFFKRRAREVEQAKLRHAESHMCRAAARGEKVAISCRPAQKTI